jgi:hypothetical protein
MKFHIIHRASCTSPSVIVGTIFRSHVSIITYTLGWDDGTFLTPDIESMACGYYAKCGKVPSCPGAPTSPISYSTPINVPWHP